MAAAERWTAEDVPDQSGRVAVVTGANSGLGFVTARELARAGAHVVLACRDTARGEAAAARIHLDVAGADIELQRLDLADLGSVRAFARRFGERHGALDLLVNNAGVMAIPRRVTSDGFEMQLAANHLGHFALTGRLMARLLAAPAPRVVAISSVLHRTARIRFDDLHGERRYSRWLAYGQAKLANLVFAHELDRRAQGTALVSVAAHPGWSATKLQSGARLARAARFAAQSAQTGALPILHAATVPDLPGGSYVGPGGPLELRGHPRLVACSAASRDPELGARLWEVSERLTGVRYDLAVPAAVAR